MIVLMTLTPTKTWHKYRKLNNLNSHGCPSSNVLKAATLVQANFLNTNSEPTIHCGLLLTMAPSAAALPYLSGCHQAIGHRFCEGQSSSVCGMRWEVLAEAALGGNPWGGSRDMRETVMLEKNICLSKNSWILIICQRERAKVSRK